MRRELVVTSKFKWAFRKFVRRDARLQKRIEDTLIQMQEDVCGIAEYTQVERDA